MDKNTFEALRGLVGTTKGNTLPTARMLRESGSPVVACATLADGSLTVFQDGFYTYSTPAGTTVYAVDRCADYAYDGGDVLPDALFADEHWAVRLLLAGEDRLEHNNNAREQGNHYSYSADAAERGNLRDPHDFVADLENRDLVEQMLSCLTEKQRQVVRMYFVEGMTQEEMGEIVGKSRQAIAKLFHSAMKKISRSKKYFAE